MQKDLSSNFGILQTTSKRVKLKCSELSPRKVDLKIEFSENLKTLTRTRKSLII